MECACPEITGSKGIPAFADAGAFVFYGKKTRPDPMLWHIGSGRVCLPVLQKGRGFLTGLQNGPAVGGSICSKNKEEGVYTNCPRLRPAPGDSRYHREKNCSLIWRTGMSRPVHSLKAAAPW